MAYVEEIIERKGVPTLFKPGDMKKMRASIVSSIMIDNRSLQILVVDMRG